MDRGLLKRSVVMVGIVALIAVIWKQCPPKQPLAYDCPDHDVKLPPLGAGDTATSLVPLAGETTPIAEFHDCQRLISLSDPNKYGALVGIWVSDVLDRLPDSLAKLPPRNLELPDSELVKSGGRMIPRPGVPTGTGLPFAEIYAWPEPEGSAQGYRPLGIERGWNCLFLFPAVGGYTARMVPVEDPYTCTRPARPDTLTTGKTLNVSFSSDDLGEGNYPPVGRWDWDGHSQYIGLGCHKRWCEVTDPFVTAFAPSDAYRLPPGATHLDRRVFEVKGWYDEQRLAQLDANGKLIPAAFKGTVIPDPKLDELDDTDAFKDVWIPVAKVALGEESTKYQKSLNLYEGKLPHGTAMETLTQVYLCTGAESSCFPAGGGPSCDFSKWDGSWWAKIVGPDGTTRYECTYRTDHAGVRNVYGEPIDIPGTARWKWDENDEQLWVRCAEGCCAVH